MHSSIRRGLTRASVLAGIALAAASVAEARDWRIVAVNGEPTEGEAVLSFDAEGALSGSTGCNRFTGTAGSDARSLIVETPLATTRMACPATLTAQEDAILTLLQGELALTYDPISTGLQLTRGDQSLELEPLGPTADDDAAHTPESQAALFDAAHLEVYGLSGPLNIRNEPSTDAPVVARVLAGTLLEGEGCETRSDRTWCQVRFIDALGTEGWAAAEYLEPAPAALRAGQGVFDDIGRLDCAGPWQQPDPQRCDFGVARDGDHSAVVTVYRPDGSERVLYFADGAFAYADTSEAGGGFDSSATRDADLSRIRVDEEHYEVPHSVVLGGEP